VRWTKRALAAAIPSGSESIPGILYGRAGFAEVARRESARPVERPTLRQLGAQKRRPTPRSR
ncbi:MAG: hypothetical protein OEW21_11955, partial [Betaproteobacteria bacterium]|nr:hypothetical protein [Betaproteobacteria bacterium]